MRKTLLSKKQLSDVLALIPSAAKQEVAIVSHLADKGATKSSDLIEATGVKNLGHVAKKINQRLSQHDLAVLCERPAIPIRDESGNVSQMFVWSLYAVKPAQECKTEIVVNCDF